MIIIINDQWDFMILNNVNLRTRNVHSSVRNKQNEKANKNCEMVPCVLKHLKQTTKVFQKIEPLTHN